MKYWLLKSEPNVWSFNQQIKAGLSGSIWDGVRNYQAANNLKKMKKGIEESVITEQKKDKILSRIKNFGDISLFAYVAGFREIKDLSFKCTGKKLIKNLLVNSAEGLITDEVLNRLAKDYKVNKGQINFAGIGKFSTYPRYVTNTGRLKYRKEDWKKIIEKL